MPKDYSALTTIGMVGWLLLVGYVLVRDSRRGNVITGSLSALIHLLIVLSIWMVVPASLNASPSEKILGLFWVAAIYPYLFFILQMVRSVTQRRPKS